MSIPSMQFHTDTSRINNDNVIDKNIDVNIHVDIDININVVY